MVHVVCPKCHNRSLSQDAQDPSNFACVKCGKFVLLPAKPESKDVPAILDYLVQAGKHLKELEQIREI